MKNNKFSPVGLKGREVNERMKSLMGIQPINENKSNSVVELTKVGPDGKIYGIVRENHDYYIKTTNKQDSVISEDFNYIGGLENKKQEAYSSYAKAIKHLNLKFNSLSEAYNTSNVINVFENDNLTKDESIQVDTNESVEVDTLFEDEDAVELSEENAAVQEMIDEDCDVIEETHRLSIKRALLNMDSIIDNLTEGNVKKKVYTLK